MSYKPCLYDINQWITLLSGDLWFNYFDGAYNSATTYLAIRAVDAVSQVMQEEGYTYFDVLTFIPKCFYEDNRLRFLLKNFQKAFGFEFEETVFVFAIMYRTSIVARKNLSLGGIYSQSANYGDLLDSTSTICTYAPLLSNIGLNIYNYIVKNKDNTIKRYNDIVNGGYASLTNVAPSLCDLIFYISNIFTCLSVDEELKYDYAPSILMTTLKQTCKGKSSLLNDKGGKFVEELSDYDSFKELYNSLTADVVGGPSYDNVYAAGIPDDININFSYASRVIAEITNVILEYLPSIQSDIAYIRTTFPDIPDVDTAKSLEKIVYSNVGTINDDINQTRDGVDLASGTTSQQVVQRVLTGSAWASAYKQYINPVKYTEIADAIKRRIFKEVL